MLKTKSTLSVWVFLLVSVVVRAQEPGAIFYPTDGSSIFLDPNSDGFITETGAPFAPGYTELSQKEGRWQHWFQVHDEPANDFTYGEPCSAFDIVDASNGTGAFYVGIYDPDGIPSDYSGNEYLLTRIRLASDPGEADFGFSLLLDTDLEFGLENDPNATKLNHGYEAEIRFKSGGAEGGIFLDHIDGLTEGETLKSYPFNKHHQKVWAQNTAARCSSQAVFIDLGIPFSDLEHFLGISSSSLLHVVAVTTPAGAPALKYGIADIAGVDGNIEDYKNRNLAMAELLNLQPLNHTLPINLSRLEYQKQNQDLKLLWETASELRVKHYEIEISTNAAHFSHFQTLEATGNSVNGASYLSTPLPVHQSRTSYYVRLKIVHVDASVEYSKVLEVHPAEISKMDVFPNPAVASVHIATESQQSGTYRLFNSAALIVKEGQYAGSFDLEVSDLPKGSYHLCLYGPQGTTQERLLVQ